MRWPGRTDVPAPAAVSVPGERHARRAAQAAAPAPRASRPRGSWGRRLSTVLLVAGAAVLADAGVTLVWQEPVTGLLAHRQQGQLAGRLRALESGLPTLRQRRELGGLRGDRSRIAFLARAFGHQAAEGSAIGELRIPRLGTRQVVVKGTAADDLRKGPGTFSGVGLPGVPGTAAIAGHRTTYGAPFRHLDRLRSGDVVRLEMPYAVLAYRVQGTKVVEPDDLSVLQRRPYDRLVLSACHPLYSASHRIVVFARLVRERPAGQLRAG